MLTIENQNTLYQKLAKRNRQNHLAIAKFLKQIHKRYHQAIIPTSPVDFPPLIKFEKSIEKHKLRYSSKLRMSQLLNLQTIPLSDTSHEDEPQQKMPQQLSLQKLEHQNLKEKSDRNTKKQSMCKIILKQQVRKPLFLKSYLLELTEKNKQSSIHQKYKQKLKIKKQRLFFPKVTQETKLFKEIQGNELRCHSLANLQKFNLKLRIA